MANCRQVLISKTEITHLVVQLVTAINKHYQNKDLDLLLLGVSKGALTFTSDLGKALWQLGYHNTTLAFVQASSYGQQTVSSGKPKLGLSVKQKEIKGKQVLVIEDLIDTGYTLQAILQKLKQFKPASLAVAVLLAKPEQQKVILPGEIPVFIGKNLKDGPWIDGYGIDTQEKNRFSPSINVVTAEPISRKEAKKLYLAN